MGRKTTSEVMDDQLIGQVKNVWRGSIFSICAESESGEDIVCSFPSGSMSMGDDYIYLGRSWMGGFACSCAGDFWEAW